MKIISKTLLLFVILSSNVFADAVTTTTVSVPTPAPVPQQPTQTTVISTSTTTTNGVSESDGRIVSSIYERFGKDAAMTGTDVTAASQNGIVTLSGAVTAQSQADEAVLVAKKIAGVKGVISNITVTTNPNGSILPPIKNY